MLQKHAVHKAHVLLLLPSDDPADTAALAVSVGSLVKYSDDFIAYLSAGTKKIKCI